MKNARTNHQHHVAVNNNI